MDNNQEQPNEGNERRARHDPDPQTHRNTGAGPEGRLRPEANRGRRTGPSSADRSTVRRDTTAGGGLR